MPEYQFCLRPHGSSEPVLEPVSALDDEEARGLAEIRLLLSHGLAAVTVSRSGFQILQLERDPPRVPPDLSEAREMRPRSLPTATGSR